MKAFHAHLLDRRLRVMRGIVAVVFAAFVVTFFRVQILGHGRYQLQSETNRLRPIPLPAPRGLITDRNGRILAENIPGYTIALLPAPEPELRSSLRRLAPIARLDAAEIERVLERHRRVPYHPAVVLADAPFDVVAALEERRLTFPGLIIQTEPKRHYPDSAITAHLVGYVGEVTEAELAQPSYAGVRLGGLVGQYGLEREYDDSLRGADGVRFVEVNARGYMVREAGSQAALRPDSGAGLQTTIDLELQRYIARIFPAGARGAVVAMNPNTGEVLALYSAPGFDPNRFVGGVTPEYWRGLTQNPARPLLNRAIQARYPPGSVWKLAVAAMGLKRGVVGARSRMPIPCRGGMAYGNRYFRCWKAEGHGDLTLSEAITHSCDVYFYQLALKLTLNQFLEDANAWGLRQRTGIDLPSEIPPEFPTGPEYYDRVYGPRRWTSAVTLNLAIGQGENAQTLVSMVQLFQMLATDGRERVPYLVRRLEEPRTTLELAPDQLTILRRAMVNVVERGTGRASRLERFTIAGKTGTAQNPHGPDHGWFIGFGPAEKPEVVVGAIIEFYRHGSAVGGLVSRVIARYLGADTAEASLFRLVLPVDSAPVPLEVLPRIFLPDTDSLLVIPPIPDR